MPTQDLHAQDAAIIIESLTVFAGNPNEIETPREERAWELVDEIAEEQHMPPSELVRQIDSSWPDSHRQVAGETQQSDRDHQ